MFFFLEEPMRGGVARDVAAAKEAAAGAGEAGSAAAAIEADDAADASLASERLVCRPCFAPLIGGVSVAAGEPATEEGHRDQSPVEEPGGSGEGAAEEGGTGEESRERAAEAAALALPDGVGGLRTLLSTCP